MRPEEVIGRIGNAMSETLTAERDRVHPALLNELSSAWDEGRVSVEPDHVFAPRHTIG
jgi:hypothetical protein